MSVEVIQLPRGGTLLKMPSGVLQLGAIPETIKDTLAILGDVPDSFVLPNKLFSVERGISLADLEFPAYYNFFVKKRPIKVYGQSHQLETILGVLREAVLGPNFLQLAREFPYGVSREIIPDLKAEMDYLKAYSPSGCRKMELTDMAVGIPWGPNHRVPFGTNALERTSDGKLKVVDGSETLACVPMDITFDRRKEVSLCRKPYEPPLFGITVIGSGSGFDPNEMTSGFIVWVNGRGVLVDPPVDSTIWLKAMDINPRLIDDCILTHCHADHDSGILQKLLEEKKINLYTTETIMESFVRKYRALTGISQSSFMNLFNFHPLTLQIPIRIQSGEFRFFYTLHSIPTIGFEVYFQGKSFVYSSDSLYDPPAIREINEKGIINRSRMNELLGFPWHHSVIFHEAGIPPIHTPISNLAKLPNPVKERLYLIHVSEKSIPEDSGLKKVTSGTEGTIVIPVSPPPRIQALEYLDVLNHIDLFSGLPIEKAREFLMLVKAETYKAGETIIRKGTVGDRFFMIVSGRAQVLCNGEVVQSYSNNDYIGETSMILNAPRNADVVAETDLKVLVMGKYDFLYFIRGTEIARHMEVIAENREYNTWALFDDSPLFRDLSPTQRTHLQGIMTRNEVPTGEVIAVEGSSRQNFFLLDKGAVKLSRKGKFLMKAVRGSFFGKIYANPMRGLHRITLEVSSPAVIYSIGIMEFYRFLEHNPGVFLLMREMKIKNQIVQHNKQSK